MSEAEDEETLRFYSTGAEGYVARGAGTISRHLPGFLDALPPRARILELGCGAGREAQAMIAAGHDVVPTDGVPEIARQAEALLGIPVRVLRFEDLDAVAEFDAVWANASLLHVPRAALPAVLARIRTALRPGGLHLASYKAGGAEGRDGYGRYFNYLSRDEVLAAYAAAGDWEVVSVSESIGGGFDRDETTRWVAVTLRRPR